jgi:hypothetical protein
MYTEFWKESLKENSYLENLVVDERIIWTLILKIARVWAGPKYVTIDCSEGMDWAQVCDDRLQ